MKKESIRAKIAYGIIALCCFLLLYGATYREAWREKNGCDIVVLGDSIMGQVRDETAIPVILAELTGRSVFNGALGGTCMSRTGGKTPREITNDNMSVSTLAEAIAVRDFGVQQTIRSRESATAYFDVTIDSMETVDFHKVEILLIQAGVNDYHAGIPIYPETDDRDPYTYVGALRGAIQDISEAYPNIRIILVTPTYSWYREEMLTCEEYNLGCGVLEQYVDAEIQVAQEMGVEIIDLYHDFYPNEKWDDWELYTSDGLHPNEAGRRLIAEAIADYLSGSNG